MKDSYFNQRRADYWKPTNWLWFFVNIRFPLGFLSIAFDIYLFLSLFIYRLTVHKTLVILYLIFILFETVRLGLNIWAMVEARRLTHTGYVLIKVSLWLEVGMAAFAGMYLQSFGSATLGVLAGACIYGLFWLLPNISYFSQRETLFQPGYYIPPEDLMQWPDQGMYF